MEKMKTSKNDEKSKKGRELNYSIPLLVIKK